MRIVPRIIAISAYLSGIAGLGLFFVYVIGNGTGYVSFGAGAEGVRASLNNLGWLLLFALQHSGMARQSCKRWLPTALERSIYVAISGIVLAGLALCWQPLPGDPIWHGPLWIEAIALSALVGAGGCCLRFNHLSFLGLQQAWTGDAATQGPLLIDGPYRFVRHPLMLGFLIALWAQPMMPPALLMLNAGMTIYILIAIQFEERDLIRQFGADYKIYRRKVPALIPFWNRIPS